MTITQLSPSIPLETPKGPGLAWFLIDPSEEHHLLWVVAIDATGEIWTFKNTEIRAQKNITMGRLTEKDKPILSSGIHSTGISKNFSPINC